MGYFFPFDIGIPYWRYYYGVPITIPNCYCGSIQCTIPLFYCSRSTLLHKRKNDYSKGQFQKWPFMSTHYWGENPAGKWKLDIENMGSTLNTGRSSQESHLGLSKHDHKIFNDKLYDDDDNGDDNM